MKKLIVLIAFLFLYTTCYSDDRTMKYIVKSYMHQTISSFMHLVKVQFFILFMECRKCKSTICFSSYMNKSLKQLLRSEEHTSELQSRFDLVCRLLLEKKKQKAKHEQQSTTDRKKYNQ